MANTVLSSSLYKFLPHRRKVLSLYKRALRHLEAHCVPLGRHEYSFERTLLRARFDLHKDEPDETKAAHILRMGEQEFWENQHCIPIPLPNSPDGGVTYQRYDRYRSEERVIDSWEPSDKAMFPDYMKNREKWMELRKKTWPEEMKALEEWDKRNIELGIPMSDALPAAKEKDGYPPFWWVSVTRPLMKPKLMHWFPQEQDT